VLNRCKALELTVPRTLDVVNHAHQSDLTELTKLRPSSHGETERALDCRADGFGHRALIVVLIFNTRVVRVIVGGEDTMLNQRANPEFTERFSECFPVVASVGCQAQQIARVPAGNLCREAGITSFPSRRAVNVECCLRPCIDEFRELQPLSVQCTRR